MGAYNRVDSFVMGRRGDAFFKIKTKKSKRRVIWN